MNFAFRGAIAMTVIAAFVQARADAIVVPNADANSSGPGAGLSLPFNQPGARWQQIYANSQFASASADVLSITALRFRLDENNLSTSFSVVVPKLNIFMSTTAHDFNTATANFAQNITTSLFEVLPTKDVSLAGSRVSATSFDVVIPLPNAYQYDRTTGNLLLDIRVPEGSDLPFLDQDGLSPGATFSVFGAVTALSGTKTEQGLVTQFEFIAVPEPGVLCFALWACPIFVKTRKLFR